MSDQRIAWVETARGLFILLVVLMPVTRHYGYMAAETGWLHPVASWVEPFAFPGFFFLCGLFVSRVLFKSPSLYFDRRVVRYAYLFLVWLLVQSMIEIAPAYLTRPGAFIHFLFGNLVEPVTRLWAIYMLAVFGVSTWLLRHVSRSRVLLAAVLLQVCYTAGLLDTGSILIDRFAQYFVFFYAGYAGIELVFKLADGIKRGFKDLPAVLGVWALANTALVSLHADNLPLVSLVCAFAGILAVISTAVMMSEIPWLFPLRWAGRGHIIIYLSYFIPMLLLEYILLATGIVPDTGFACLVILLGSVSLPIIFYAAIRPTPLCALYRRPVFLKLKQARTEKAGRLIGSH